MCRDHRERRELLDTLRDCSAELQKEQVEWNPLRATEEGDEADQAANVSSTETGCEAATGKGLQRRESLGNGDSQRLKGEPRPLQMLDLYTSLQQSNCATQVCEFLIAPFPAHS